MWISTPPPTQAEQAIFDAMRFTSEQIARVFAVPAWLIDGTVRSTETERAAWRRTLEKDARRRRYRRRYDRGRR